MTFLTTCPSGELAFDPGYQLPSDAKAFSTDTLVEEELDFLGGGAVGFKVRAGRMFILDWRRRSPTRPSISASRKPISTTLLLRLNPRRLLFLKVPTIENPALSKPWNNQYRNTRQAIDQRTGSKTRHALGGHNRKVIALGELHLSNSGMKPSFSMKRIAP